MATWLHPFEQNIMIVGACDEEGSSPHGCQEAERER
jgi:hypothetical protein